MKGLSKLFIGVLLCLIILATIWVLVNVILARGICCAGDIATTIRATGQCNFRCEVLCQMENKSTGTPSGWAKEYVKVVLDEVEENVSCSLYIPKCKCEKAP